MVIYHSHPDVGTYFSKEDSDKALFNGIPIYPVRYLVIDIKKGNSVGAKLFEYQDGKFIYLFNF